jgi:hypothetical protein
MLGKHPFDGAIDLDSGHPGGNHLPNNAMRLDNKPAGFSHQANFSSAL